MTLFGPDGRVRDRAALRSVQFAGARPQPRTRVDREADVRIVETLRDDTGEPAGYQTHHGSGRVDATVLAIAPGTESGV